MHLEFKKAVQFSLLLKVGGRLREFNFRKINRPNEEKFSVNVCNDKGERILFDMKENDSEWDFITPTGNLPLWISDARNDIREALSEELKSW